MGREARCVPWGMDAMGVGHQSHSDTKVEAEPVRLGQHFLQARRDPMRYAVWLLL